MKYPPVPLVLVGDGDLHGLSSAPHPLPRGVIAEQGKASQLVLTGTVEICKAKKQDQKGFTPAMIATSHLFCSVAVPSKHSQDPAAGVGVQLLPPTRKSKDITGDQERVDSHRHREMLGRLSLEVCMDQVGLPACPSEPSWHLPRRPQGAPCNQEGGGRAHCALWSPSNFSTYRLARKGSNKPWVCLICPVQAITDQSWLHSVGWSEHYLFAGPTPSP